ncbi:unnamed protein product [Rotaria magnacalcarata]|uniref:Thioredoxin domain-containing protein n=6 Tax=Rotaria magnacalcarata TaxID=392030 RepID=A0A819EUI5_9BILA|nr:unnamed protein product [Rotaria magnacalcarata]CAF4032663.1 unnamed protein product [Rotaria magnacalcarata]
MSTVPDDQQSSNHLTGFDITALVIYFILLIGTGFYSMFKYNRSTVKGYFLANRQMPWICIGASLFASNIGAEHFIGLASSGAAKGISVGAFELNSIAVIQLLGWVFLPVFIATGVSTLPEYMSKRFGGQRIRVYIACLYLLLYILTKISVNIYAASLFINYAFHWNLYLSVLFVLMLTALCTVSGGLASVMYTDTIQAAVMIIGGFALMVLSYTKIGGMSNLYREYLKAMPSPTIDQQYENITNVWLNQTAASITCGKPSMKSFQMLRSLSDPDMPWLGFFLGHTPNTIWYWCSDQMMVQRVLAAKTISHARGGTLLAGYLKILPLFMIIIPGMISRTLFPDIVACNQPSTCEAVCHSKRSCTNIAYPTLILKILPNGFKGIMLAVMLAALISGLTSIFNSASTIFTVDLYPNILFYRRNKITNRESMIVGRLFVIIMTAFGIAWIPIVIQMQGSELYIYMQQVIGFLAPPIACIYLLSVLWTRANERGAFAGLMIGFVFGLVRMILEFSQQPPLCGEKDTRFWLVRKVHFMYYALFLFWLTFFTCVIVSLLTEPPTKEQLNQTTFWTRNSDTNMELIRMKHQINNEASISSRSLHCNEVASSAPMNHALVNTVVEQTPSEIFLPPSSPLGPGTLLRSHDGDDDICSVRISTAHTSTTELEFKNIKTFSNCSPSIPNNSNKPNNENTGCDMLVLLKSCWSWFCGLDDTSATDDQDELSAVNTTYHCLQRKPENSDTNEARASMLQHMKERPIIKWILNGNLVFVILIEITLFVVFSLPANEPIPLTDKTWKDMLCGQWMVEFYAPWCPSCQYFTPIWSDFAKEMISKEIKVAAVDINDYPSLSGRFRISVLPTIYYVRDGVFRQFNGERTLSGLKNYIELQEWQRTDPVSSFVAPDSLPMSIISSIFDVSVLVKDAYTILQDTYGWPSWLIYIFFTVVIIFVGLVLGFGVLMIIDYCVTGTVKDDINNLADDSKDVEDLDDNDSQKILKPKTAPSSVPKLIASSTPQRKIKSNISSSVTQTQDDEALLDEILGDDNDDSEGLNTSDMAQATDEDEQTPNVVIRQRRVNK